MSRKVLLVDDEQHVLEGYYRNLRKQFSLEVALGGVQAIQAFEEHGPFAVVVSDMRMPGMSGVELLEEARERFPEVIRIMLTGNADQQTAVDAVNRGAVFRFLNKPCAPADLALAIEAGLRQYDLIRAEKELLEGTLTGAVQVLTEVVSLKEGREFELAAAIRERALGLANRLGMASTWNLEVASMLAPLGSLAPRPLQESKLQRDPLHPYSPETLVLSARMVEGIPRMQEVATTLRYMGKHFDGSGMPADGLAGTDLPLESRILMVAAAFTTTERIRRHAQVALEELRRKASWFDPVVLQALGLDLELEKGGQNLEMLPAGALREGHVLAQDVTLRDGFMVFSAGTRLGKAHLLMLSDLMQLVELPEAIPVRREA